jgi:hypothetical protein
MHIIIYAILHITRPGDHSSKARSLHAFIILLLNIEKNIKFQYFLQQFSLQRCLVFCGTIFAKRFA